MLNALTPGKARVVAFPTEKTTPSSAQQIFVRRFAANCARQYISYWRHGGEPRF